MAIHSSIICWRIPWTEDRGAWWATVYRVPKSRTWLKWLSMHAWALGPGKEEEGIALFSSLSKRLALDRPFPVLSCSEIIGLCWNTQLLEMSMQWSNVQHVRDDLGRNASAERKLRLKSPVLNQVQDSSITFYCFENAYLYLNFWILKKCQENIQWI